MSVLNAERLSELLLQVCDMYVIEDLSSIKTIIHSKDSDSVAISSFRIHGLDDSDQVNALTLLPEWEELKKETNIVIYYDETIDGRLTEFMVMECEKHD